MKKIISFSLFFVVIAYICFSQTTMTLPRQSGKVKVWAMASANALLGNVYTMGRGANWNIAFSPSQNAFANAVMVVTGTYTSDDMKVAGSAYQNCNQIGNQQDKYFKPNAYLIFQNGTISFSDQSSCNSIQVYKLIDKSTILSDVVNARTKSAMVWRFFVEKRWIIKYNDGTKEMGRELLIVDFHTALTLAEACAYVKGLERNTVYRDFNYVSTVTACLLDTGIFRPFLLNGNSVHGTFPTQQSNVIVVK